MYRNFIKRLLDVIFSLLLLILLSPVFLILMILVKVKLGSPIFFKQERPGKAEKIFKLYKFRTMTDKKDEKGNLLPDEERLTSFGKLLRSTSFDELPELFNILKGEMSFIGPRPLLVEYLSLSNDIFFLWHCLIHYLNQKKDNYSNLKKIKFCCQTISVIQGCRFFSLTKNNAHFTKIYSSCK